MKNVAKLVFVTLFIAVVMLGLDIPLWSQTYVGGIIDDDTTWGDQSLPYVVTDSILVADGVTLSIGQGVRIEFNSDTELVVDGILIAEGALSNCITFTSANGDPQKGDWKGTQP